jgi:hypothetical protein
MVEDAPPWQRFRDLDKFTGSLMIVKGNISSQTKDDWNLGVEAKQVKLQDLTKVGKRKGIQ